MPDSLRLDEAGSSPRTQSHAVLCSIARYLWLDAPINALNEGLRTFKDDLIKLACFTASRGGVVFFLTQDINVVQTL